jgi:cell division protein ZapA (FtsZ GTPase activity inhibitor)
MDEKQFKELNTKLDIITRLLALNMVKDMENQKEKIAYLSAIGFGPVDIARLLNTTANTVSVRLNEIKKKSANVPADKEMPTVENIPTETQVEDKKPGA